ncbi:putative Mitochondrial inner membrane protease ATP23-like protein [Hypsibius exemplaris]|uniref:Mitochondrial inner membrane protease ATP23 n=1 Tax=Hypsibius exemplaris TaxID=2072580 RepID=A0A1W0X941_HYPEX|nr:putative Mitochondrial inner membrane protease ATP23-like protein [Hypsibius exemplaris]
MQSSDQPPDPMAEILKESLTPAATATAAAAAAAVKDDKILPRPELPSLKTRFPEHETGVRIKPTWQETVMGFGKNDSWKVKCEAHVRSVLKNSVPVKLLTEALSSVGCEFDISRHIACEQCDESVGGGFDTKNLQIVICQNVSTTEGKVTSVLAHEMIHAFDYCRMNADFTNVDHVACSEIRASTLTHCSFLSALFQGAVTPWDFTNKHQDCVKIKATESTMSALNVPFEVALAAVEKVFPRCYADREPFGRIPRRNSRDVDKSYYERFYYGYGS